MIDMEYKGAIAKLTCEREKNNTPSLDIAYSMAIEALEKQIPKKPLPKGTHKGIDNFYCSNCMHPLTKDMKHANYHIAIYVDKKLIGRKQLN